LPRADFLFLFFLFWELEKKGSVVDGVPSDFWH
jgi:hypothetical protein